MGFSTAGAFAVISVSILIAVEILTGNLLPTMFSVRESYDDMRDRMIDYIKTDINITSVTNISDAVNLSITIENTGSISLKLDDLTLLINGTKTTFTHTQMYLYPEEQTNLTVSYQTAGPKRIKIVTNNGISDYYEYAGGG